MECCRVGCSSTGTAKIWFCVVSVSGEGWTHGVTRALFCPAHAREMLTDPTAIIRLLCEQGTLQKFMDPENVDLDTLIVETVPVLTMPEWRTLQ